MICFGVRQPNGSQMSDGMKTNWSCRSMTVTRCLLPSSRFSSYAAVRPAKLPPMITIRFFAGAVMTRLPRRVRVCLAGLAEHGSMPTRERSFSMGHHCVNADCNRFSPTNAVNRNQYGETKYPSASERRTNVPAIARM